MDSVAHFSDHELDRAYREYLHRCEEEHNAQLNNIADEEVAVLIQEDWIAAQSALQSEHHRSKLNQIQTILLKPQQDEDAVTLDDLKTVSAPALPPIAVHVYELPTVSAQSRLRVVSEQELMQGIKDKLKPHLSNAVAGMVRQAVQKKLATISYDLQIMLNDETPKLIDDVLSHNLETIFRTVKRKLRDKE